MIFVEGVGDVVLPCAAAIVVPGIVAALAGGRHGRLAGLAFATTVGIGLWVRASGFFAVQPIPLLVAAGFAVAAGLFVFGGRGGALGGSILAGSMAAWMWQPCVGERLGEALTTATRDPAAAFGPLVAYGIGLCAVPIAIGFAVQTKPLRRVWAGRAATGVAAAGLGALAVLAAVGWYEEIVARLLQWSVQ